MAQMDLDRRRATRAHSRSLTGAGVDHEFVVLPAAGHAFFWPGTPPFSQQARDDAWARVLTLLAG